MLTCDTVEQAIDRAGVKAGNKGHEAAVACLEVANLNAQLATSLGQVPDGVAEDQGVRYGERAAERIIELRANDGRFAPVVFAMPLAPGVWTVEWTRVLPSFAAAYFSPATGSQFPLFPWIGFILLGAGLGAPIAARTRRPTTSNFAVRKPTKTAQTMTL